MKLLLNAVTCAFGLMNCPGVNENDSPIEVIPIIDVDITSPTTTDLFYLDGAYEKPSNSTKVIDGFFSTMKTVTEKMENVRTKICSKHIIPHLENSNHKMLTTLIYDRLSLCSKPKPMPPKIKLEIIKDYVIEKAATYYNSTMTITTQIASHSIETVATYYNNTMTIISTLYSSLSSYTACISSNIKTGMSTLLDFATSDELTAEDDFDDDDTNNNNNKSTIYHDNDNDVDDKEETTETVDEIEESFETILSALVMAISGCIVCVHILVSLYYEATVDNYTLGFVSFCLYKGMTELGFTETCCIGYQVVTLTVGVVGFALAVQYMFSGPQEHKMMWRSFEHHLGMPVTARHTILGWKIWKWGSTSAIKKEFRRLSLKYHPDKFKPTPQMTKEQAIEKFKAISEAHSYLTGRN